MTREVCEKRLVGDVVGGFIVRESKGRKVLSVKMGMGEILWPPYPYPIPPHRAWEKSNIFPFTKKRAVGLLIRKSPLILWSSLLATIKKIYYQDQTCT